MSSSLSGRGGSADAVVNAAAAEFRFGAVVLTKKLVFVETYEKIGLAGSHFSTHGYAISLFVVVTTEWKAIECEYYGSARRSSVSELGSLTVRWS